MAELRGESDLEEKPLRTKARRQFWVQHLERDPPLVLQILRQVDGGHPTASELALDRVAVGQGGLKPFQDLDQGDLSEWGVSTLQPSSRSGQTPPEFTGPATVLRQEQASWGREGPHPLTRPGT